MKPLLWSLVVTAVVCSLSLFVTQWMGLADNWRIFVSVFWGYCWETVVTGGYSVQLIEKFSGKRNTYLRIFFFIG